MFLNTLRGICRAIRQDSVVSIATGYSLYIFVIESY
jgi:hypothetical protein